MKVLATSTHGLLKLQVGHALPNNEEIAFNIIFIDCELSYSFQCIVIFISIYCHFHFNNNNISYYYIITIVLVRCHYNRRHRVRQNCRHSEVVAYGTACMRTHCPAVCRQPRYTTSNSDKHHRINVRSTQSLMHYYEV